MSPPLISKAAARYTGAGGKEHCSLCRHFSPRRGGRCARVLGDISPMGWCRLFSREMRGLVADAASFNGGGGGPSLSLDFLTPGTLDPRITFTRASTATYFDSAGVMRTATVNTPRWDYDPVTPALRGLLLEDQRTNALPESNAFTTWTATNLTNTPASGVAPDGNNTMIRLAETVAAGTHYIAKTVVTAASTIYTASLFAKAAQNRYLQLGVDDTASTGAYVTFDLQTGTITGPLTARGSAVLGSAVIQSVGNGIYRCSVSSSIAAATTMRYTIICSNAANPVFAPSYTGNAANGLLVWGVQLERGNAPSSYIATTAGAVTRSIDSCLILPASMGWFTAPGGSWFAEFDYADATPANSRIIGRPDTAGGVSPLLLNATRNVAQNDGATLATANATTVGVITKACSTWAAGSARICANGGAVALSASLATGYGAFTAAGIRFLSVGAALSADNTSGHIRAVRYWSSVLTDTEMQTVTTL